MNGTFEIKLNRDEYMSAYWLCARRFYLWRRLLSMLVKFTLAAAIVLIGLDALTGEFHPSYILDYLYFAVICVLIVTAILVPFTLLMLPRRVGKMFRQLDIEGRVTRYEFDDEGIRSSNDEASTNYAWNKFRSWSEDKRSLILKMADFVFIAVPKSQVSAEVLALLREAIGGASIPVR